MVIVQWVRSVVGGAGCMAVSIGMELFKRGYNSYLFYEDDSHCRYWGTEKRSRSDISNARFPVKQLPDDMSIFDVAIDLNADVIIKHVWMPEDARLTRTGKELDVLCIAFCRTASLPGLRGYDQYIFVSQSQIDTVPAPRDQPIRVVRNGIDHSVIQSIREHRPISPFRIVRVSGLSPEKISESYLEVLSRIAREDRELLFIGGGGGREILESEAKKQGWPNARFTGDLDLCGVLRAYKSSHISLYMTGSHIENHSVSLIEAAACGVPVLCENRGGLPEQVVHWRTGVVCNTPDEFVKCVDYLHDHRNILCSMSEMSQSYSRFYDIYLTVTDLLRILAEVLPRFCAPSSPQSQATPVVFSKEDTT